MNLMESKISHMAKTAVRLLWLFYVCFWRKKEIEILSKMSKQATKSMCWSCVDKRSMLLRKSYGSVMILPAVCSKQQGCRLSYREAILKKNCTQKNEYDHS